MRRQKPDPESDPLAKLLGQTRQQRWKYREVADPLRYFGQDPQAAVPLLRQMRELLTRGPLPIEDQYLVVAELLQAVVWVERPPASSRDVPQAAIARLSLEWRKVLDETFGRDHLAATILLLTLLLHVRMAASHDKQLQQANQREAGT